ncbi:Rrf2 family transcriptional regulator [bacterium]|nr:Rrf2 family transcriptional regulator [bacterium]
MPLRLNTMVRYAVRIMLSLASRWQGSYISANVIAKEQEISVDYAEQILRKLRLGKLVESNRGPEGGFKLTKPPSEISLMDIVIAMQGRVHLIRCLEPNGEKHCHRAPNCSARIMWQKLGEKVADFLSNNTLEDVLKEARELLPKDTPPHSYPYVI